MRSLPPRLAAFYFTYFAGLGVMLPYLNLYFERIGMSGVRIGVLSAILPLGRVLLPPLWAWHADRTGLRRGLTLAACALTVVALAGFLVAAEFPALVAACLALALVDGPRLPMVEATAVDLSQSGRIDYGRVRGWGSVGFILSSLAMGAALASQPARLVLYAMLFWAALNTLAALGLPRDRREEPAAREPVGAVLRRPAIAVFLAACFLMQASHGAYYTFFTIHLDRQGYGGAAIGGLWALGVTAEVAIMFFSRRWLGRVPPVPLMMACTLAAAVRWSVLAVSSAPAAVAPAQTLHALTFAAFHIAAVNGIQRLFPASLRAFGQSMLGAMTYALGNVAGSLLSGALFDRAGAGVMFAAAAGLALMSVALLAAIWRSPRLRGDAAV